MRAIVVKQQKLELGEVPDPELREGDLLVAVKAAGVNRADLLQRMGRYPPPPGEPETIGLEIAGEGLEPSTRRGERVMALLAGGGYAERARVPAAQAMPIPRGLDFAQAAAIPEAFLTSWLNLSMLGGLKKGDVVVVHAAASGVGSAALQLCRGIASVVLATASPGKHEACRALGATHVLARAEVPARLAEAVKEAAGRGADIVFDLVGGSYLEANVAALGLHGRLCCISTMGGAKGTLDLGALLYKRLSILGSTVRSRTAAQKAKLVADFAGKALPRFDAGELKPVLAKTFPLAEAQAAHQSMQNDEVVGKIVLVP
ncbi:MAG: NAD(P)H-quinone oxidoreductase [Myxococcales bacterium]